MNKGQLVPGDWKNAERWSLANKFAVVLETASLNESELALYCRKKGLYAEQINAGRSACVDANANVKEHEKALAETVALLVLRKKVNTILGYLGSE